MNIADLHFLVAEDHEFQRKTLIIALKSLGAKHILEAADGRVAFELFSDLATPVDVIICDLEMPNMDGMEFIRHIGNADAVAHFSAACSPERPQAMHLAPAQPTTLGHGPEAVSPHQKYDAQRPKKARTSLACSPNR